MAMRVVQIDQFVNEPEEVDWLIDGLLADAGWTLLYSPPGYGKSTFALQLCNALKEGKPFLEKPVRQAMEFAYVQADGTGAEWRAICKRVIPKSTGKSVIDVPMYGLDNAAYVEYIDKSIQHIKPGFVVFDSLYSLTAIDINTPRVLHAINVMKMLAMRNTIPWLLIHHPTKNDPSSPAGSQSLIANCSNDWNLLKTKLSIRKGRLVKDKEILLYQEPDYTWHLYKRGTSTASNGEAVKFRRQV